MSDLVERLCQGSHLVEVGLRPEKSAKAFRECLDRGYVHVKFTNTRGGTELGVRVDDRLTSLEDTDFVNPQGTVHLVGTLSLNGIEARCIAEIDLTTLSGIGHLERREES
jgi:hypothetical protein